MKKSLGPSSYFTIFSYKPIVYFGVATFFHLSIKKVSISALFIHVSALILINNYDLNKGIEKANPEKWK